ncbi:hypothetical protein RFI_12364 [Reticulomyxa filosa]|uniref:SAP domain-containing protein n=1 Tax=Reticulomyxa filosa TaxID=46433 RepID=X6NHG4_RETFI|nr:hypothetical protein RFI_12364 [Reticulomyxa filosa]|eukprot:ETO24792.1 hypothetical protein RFI_12364 [Reticulomyxa filosa]
MSETKPSEEEIKSWTVVKLRERCKAVKKDHVGKKAELQQRLLTHYGYSIETALPVAAETTISAKKTKRVKLEEEIEAVDNETWLPPQKRQRTQKKKSSKSKVTKSEDKLLIALQKKKNKKIFFKKKKKKVLHKNMDRNNLEMKEPKVDNEQIQALIANYRNLAVKDEPMEKESCTPIYIANSGPVDENYYPLFDPSQYTVAEDISDESDDSSVATPGNV